MKYLLKFKIQTWASGYDVEYDLIFKVEFIDEMVKKYGFFQVRRGDLYQSSIILSLKSCEIVEGRKKIYDEAGCLVFNIRDIDFQDYLTRSLDIHSKCASANFMGMEPVVDEEPQSISSQKCE